MKVLTVTAHADDFETHMGGLMIRLLDAGHYVESIVTTAGQRGQRYGDRSAYDVRREESMRAHTMLGINPLLLSHFEQEFSATPENRQWFKALIEWIHPDVVFAHTAHDVNPDHRTTAILVMEACWLFGVNVEIFAFEPSSSGRSPGTTRPQAIGFTPTHYCNVSSERVRARKRALVECHQSQNPDAMWSGQMRVELNRGAQCGVVYAEAYMRLTRYGEVPPELLEFLMPTPYDLPPGTGAEVTPEAIGLSTAK